MDTRNFRKTRFISTVLPNSTTTEPSAIVTAPADSALLVEGYMHGSTGEFGYLSNDSNVFTTEPRSSSFPFYNGSYAVAVGEKFRIILGPREALFGYASEYASGTTEVWFSAQVTYVSPDAFEEGGGASGGGGGKFVGPRPVPMKG